MDGWHCSGGRPHRVHPEAYRRGTCRLVLVPLAAAAGIYHVRVHAAAARLPNPPGRLAALSNIALMGALLLQIDFGSWNCGWDTLSGVAWRLGWASEKGCILIRGLPAILLDLALYIPVVVTWRRLRAT